MKTALILIDMQNDYFPGGAMELEGSLEAVWKASELLESFRKRALDIFHVRHDSIKEDASFFLPGTHGAEFHARVVPRDGEHVIVKNFPNSFRDTALFDQLKEAGISRLLVAGMMTHMCVDATVRAAVDFGFECAVVSNASATRRLHFNKTSIAAADVHGAFLAALSAAYATVLTAEEAGGWVSQK
ncbi:cysteine hydrolase family protein [Pseudodesulfovibrio piezophilus]|uniref:Uncharacterized isochorismatase family protein yddQ n=1 Tax=Pseudodesulfovibrio piezophilus (strain DSM 21447 / JCM 15486 / C1TLV30) TaxID=1322246 RepID=M1WYI8_PSEP2|nr:cysteine hydrolase family protein [Pseudodesulfovibrio piezophilus]CCH50373.1 Uncharacterized isochorismatase family protein yddQ [Pseudodesulfovibrio piezophilus C1TLV30]